MSGRLIKWKGSIYPPVRSSMLYFLQQRKRFGQTVAICLSLPLTLTLTHPGKCSTCWCFDGVCPCSTVRWQPVSINLWSKPEYLNKAVGPPSDTNLISLVSFFSSGTHTFNFPVQIRPQEGSPIMPVFVSANPRHSLFTGNVLSFSALVSGERAGLQSGSKSQRSLPAADSLFSF